MWTDNPVRNILHFKVIFLSQFLYESTALKIKTTASKKHNYSLNIFPKFILVDSWYLKKYIYFIYQVIFFHFATLHGLSCFLLFLANLYFKNLSSKSWEVISCTLRFKKFYFVWEYFFRKYPYWTWYVYLKWHILSLIVMKNQQINILKWVYKLWS